MLKLSITRGDTTPIQQSAAKPSVTAGVNQTDFTQLLYSEFRWQRRLMFLLILFLLLVVPFLLWWMQSNSLNAAVTAAKLATPTASKTTDDAASTTNTATGIPGTNGANGARGRTGATGATGAKGDPGPSSTSQATSLSCTNQNCVNIQDSTPGTTQHGNINIDGTLIAGHLSGDGSLLSNVDAATLSGQPATYYTNASNINSGTLADNRLSQNVALLNSSPTFNGTISAQGLQLTNAVTVPNGGTGHTSLPANQLLVGNGTEPLLSLAASSNGQCLMSTANGPSFATCPTTDLQTAFAKATSGTPAITTTSNNQTINFRAGIDNAQLLQIISANGTTTFGINSATGAANIGNGTTSAQLNVNAASPTTIGIAVKEAAGQVADLFQAKDNSGITIARIDASGNAFFNNSTQTGTATFASLHADSVISNGLISTTTNILIGTGTPVASLQVNASAAQVGQLIKAASNQVADLLQIQDSSGTNLLRVNASGELYVKSVTVAANITVNGHIISAGSPPTISSILNVLTPIISGDDTAGNVTLTTTLGISAGTMAHVSFATPYSKIPRVVISATSSAAANLPVYVNVSANGFDIVSASATAAANIYSYNYVIIE